MNSVACGRDEAGTVWLYTCSAFGQLKQWWPAAVELLYQNTAWHPGSDAKVAHVSRVICKTIHRFHNRFSQSRRRPLLGPSLG